MKYSVPTWDWTTTAFDNMTAGVALTHSTGEMDFDAGDLGYRNVDAKVTSLMPYLRWSPRARLEPVGIIGLWQRTHGRAGER